MNYRNLEKNLTDMIMEQQAKLGYISETVRLYYPLASLNAILGETLTQEEMQKALLAFSKARGTGKGTIHISHEGERFCIMLSPEMSEYVHSLASSPENMDFRFIKDFVRTITQHDCTI